MSGHVRVHINLVNVASNVKKKGGKPTLVTLNIVTNVGQSIQCHVNSHVGANVKRQGWSTTLVTPNIVTNVGSNHKSPRSHVNSHVNLVNVEVNVKKTGC